MKRQKAKKSQRYGSPVVMVRMSQDMIDEVDAFAASLLVTSGAAVVDVQPSRSDAIRYLLRLGLDSAGKIAVRHPEAFKIGRP